MSKDKLLEWLEDHPHMTIDLHKSKEGYDVVVRYHTFQSEKNAVSFCKFLQYSLTNETEQREPQTIH
jgi:hypothetical protein